MSSSAKKTTLNFFGSIKTLDDLAREWPDSLAHISNDHLGALFLLWRFWLINPIHNGWIKLCQGAAKNCESATEWAGGTDPKGILSFVKSHLHSAGISKLEAERHMHCIRACLRCALFLGRHSDAFKKGYLDPQFLHAIVEETSLPKGFIVDLAHVLDVGELRRPIGTSEQYVLLIEGEENGRSGVLTEPKGVLAELKLELMPDGQGVFYPTPNQAFMKQKNHFAESLDTVRELLTSDGSWSSAYDIRWELTRIGNNELITDLDGPSASATIATGASWLLHTKLRSIEYKPP